MLTLEKGRTFEAQAQAYLHQQGLKLILQNYRCRLGEIDLIMQDKDSLVFVEVRARTKSVYGDGLVSVTYAKQQKIIKTALHYAMHHKTRANCPWRFDVVSVDSQTAAITWVQNAFGQNY